MNSNTNPEKITPAEDPTPERHFDAVTVAVLASRSSATLARLPYADVALPVLTKGVAELLDPRELTAAYLCACECLSGAMGNSPGGWSLVIQGVTSGFGINPRGFYWNCVRVNADGHVFPLELAHRKQARRPGKIPAGPNVPSGALSLRGTERRKKFPLIFSAAAAATMRRAGECAGRNSAAFLTLTYAIQKREGCVSQTVECRLPPRIAAMFLAASQLASNSPARLCCAACRKVARLSHNCVRCAQPLMCGACAKLRATSNLSCTHAECQLRRGAAPAVQTASVCPRCHTARPRELAQLPCPTCLHGPEVANSELPNERRAA
jgi:hypothetical protein